MQLFDEKKMFEIINQNSDYRKIAEYILEKFGKKFSYEEARKIAKYLILEKKFTKEEILQGNADEYLKKRAHIKLIMFKSVRQKDEQIVEIPLRTNKHFIKKEEILRLIILIAGLASTVMILGVKSNDYKNAKMREETSINIGLLASEVGSDSYNKERNIVIQSALENKDPETGMRISPSESLANNIIDVCIKDPSLFDVTIYDAYYNIDYNRVDRLSNTWGYLQNYMAKDEAFTEIRNNKLRNTFLHYILDMLVANGKINVKSKDCQNYLDAINEYQKVLKYEDLSKENKVVLKEMMDKYHDLGNNLYKKNSDTIESLVEEQAQEFGGR